MTIAYAGTEVNYSDTPNSRPVITGRSRQGFMVAEAERGPLYPVKCTSLSAVTGRFGTRQSYSFLYDSAEAFFAEAGSADLWVSRAASSTATTAALNLSDGSATTLVAKVIGPGTYGNNLNIEVITHGEDASIASGSFQFKIYEGGTTAPYLVESSPVFASKAEALLWAPSNGQGNAQTFTLTDSSGTGIPVHITPTAFGGTTSGADNRGGIADGDFQAAIDKFTPDLGTGQVAMPGQTTSTRILMVVAHALARNRHAVFDFADTPTVATLVAAAATMNAAPSSGARFSSGYWPWYQTPPLTGAFGFRTIPPSGAVMGLMARAEAEGGDAGIAAAGLEHGQFRFVSGLSQDPTLLTDANWASLDAAGVNVAVKMFEAADILKGYFEKGGLYGATAAEAFSVDATSDQVNPPSQLEAGNLHLAVGLRTTPSPNKAYLTISRVSITRSL
jgi:hypothetical protein